MTRIEKISTELDNIDYIKEWEWKSSGGKLGVYFPKDRSHAGTAFMRKMKKMGLSVHDINLRDHEIVFNIYD